MFKMTCWAPEYGRWGGISVTFNVTLCWCYTGWSTGIFLHSLQRVVWEREIMSISLGKSALLMLQVRGKRPIYFEVMGTSSLKWTIENWRTIAWSVYWFLLQHSDDRIECGVNNIKAWIQAAAGGVMWRIFSWHTLARLVLNWASFKPHTLHEYP